VRTPRPLKAASLAASILFLAGFGRCGSSEWKLVWSDEFDGGAGQPPDPAVWTPEVGTGWGNAQLEYDTDRVENASTDGQGNLAITAIRESYQGRQYTSARLITQGKREQRLGKIEARIKLPVGQGMWPAFWMLGANIDSVGWPTCGEIDVVEYRGQEPTVAIGALHGPGYSGGSPISRSTTLPSGEGLDQDFHVFSVEWDEKLVTWSLDGQLYHAVSSVDLPSGAPWVFDAPFFMILNLAVGGTFVGPPDASTVFPQTMLVDYVRVYERDP
jgi:beta-glucanase (GH16 family)